MSQQKDQWIKASALLLELTQSGELKWTCRSPSQSFAPDLEGQVDLILTTTFADWPLRLYEKRSTRLVPDVSFTNVVSQIVGRASMVMPMKEQQVTETLLELVDEKGRGLWTVPSNGVLPDLIREAKYIASGAGDLLTRLLNTAHDKKYGAPQDPA